MSVRKIFIALQAKRFIQYHPCRRNSNSTHLFDKNFVNVVSNNLTQCSTELHFINQLKLHEIANSINRRCCQKLKIQNNIDILETCWIQPKTAINLTKLQKSHSNKNTFKNILNSSISNVKPINYCRVAYSISIQRSN